MVETSSSEIMKAVEEISKCFLSPFLLSCVKMHVDDVSFSSFALFLIRINR